MHALLTIILTIQNHKSKKGEAEKKHYHVYTVL